MQLQITPEVITSVSFSQHEILRRILQLYCLNGFDADFTYNVGNFYKNGIPQPRQKFDLKPQAKGVIKADVCALPIHSASVTTGVFDPPFLVGTEKYIMNEKYGYFKNMKELYNMYTGAFKEFNRVFIKGGILVFKCQDVVNGSQYYLNSTFVVNLAREYDFECIDCFICINRNPIVTHHKQQHSRTTHTFFYVFRLRSRIRKVKGAVHGF